MENISLRVLLRSSNIRIHSIYTDIFDVICQLLTAVVDANKMGMLFC